MSDPRRSRAVTGATTAETGLATTAETAGLVFTPARADPYPRPYPRTTDLAEFRRRATPMTQAFYDYWDSKRAGRGCPPRADLDPLEMTEWLTGLQIVDVFNHPRRLKYRLVGTVEVESRGFNPTGRWVEDGFIGVSREDVLYNYNTVIDQQTLLYDWGEYVCGGGYLLWQETIFLPLSSDGATVDKVITFAVTRRLDAPAI